MIGHNFLRWFLNNFFQTNRDAVGRIPHFCFMGDRVKFGCIYYDKGKYYRHTDCRQMPNRLLQALASPAPIAIIHSNIRMIASGKPINYYAAWFWGISWF